MADEKPTTTPAAPKRRIGWGYLVLALLILGIAGVFMAAPDLPRNLLSFTPPKPTDLGSEPTAAGDTSNNLAEKRVQAEIGELGQVRTWRPTAAAAAPAAAPAVVDKPEVATNFKDEARAQELLAQSEKLYTAMQWTEAEGAARRLDSLDAKPVTKGRAADIARSAPKLARLFKDLNEREELSRNWETHPSLVSLDEGGKTYLAVPLMSLQNPEPVEGGDPVAWLKNQAQAGKVAVRLQGAKDFIPSEIELSRYTVTKVDLGEVRAQRQAQLERRISDIKVNKAALRDASVWYEAGKFAYRNRLDDQVTKLLDKALDLDPFLNRTIREGNAQVAFGAMVAHMKNGNKQQAAAYMARIAKLYADTEQGKSARLYYDGKTSELLAAERENTRKQKELEEERLKARLKAAEEKQDQAKVAELKKEAEEKPAEDTIDAAPAAPAGNDPLAKARSLRDQGQKLVADAMAMPATAARNDKYHEAAKILTQARNLFAAFCEKNPKDESTENEMIECGKMLFAAKKYATAF